jgi:hypothetical protein
MKPGMMPILHSSGVMHARAVRADQARSSSPASARFDAHHVEHRNAFGDAHDRARCSASIGLEDRIGREPGGGT